MEVNPGDTFGRWTVLEFVRYDGNHRYYRCRCQCGTEKTITANNLKRGMSVSCGCYRDDRIRDVKTTHGQAGKKKQTREYKSWCSMIARCTNPNNTHYKDYGGRKPIPIEVCERWSKFENFFEDMGLIPAPRLTLDRIDNDLGYSRDNCRWATRKQQARNRRSSRLIEYKGRTQPLAVWAEELGLGRLLESRLSQGWSVDDAIETPTITPMLYEFNGERKMLSEWAKKLGIHKMTLHERLNKWSVQRALSEPPKKCPKGLG